MSWFAAFATALVIVGAAAAATAVVVGILIWLEDNDMLDVVFPIILLIIAVTLLTVGIHSHGPTQPPAEAVNQQ